MRTEKEIQNTIVEIDHFLKTVEKNEIHVPSGELSYQRSMKQVLEWVLEK